MTTSTVHAILTINFSLIQPHSNWYLFSDLAAFMYLSASMPSSAVSWGGKVYVDSTQFYYLQDPVLPAR